MDSEQLDLLAQARVGTIVKGKWHLDRLIGVGGMAAVYAATHRNRKKAALKILHLEYSAQEAIRERFMREGYVANTVGHGGVVKIDDDDVTEDGAAFLVLELVEGETLEERLTREGPLPADEVLGYLDQVLDAVAVAHAKGIVHRDLKPDNMLLSKEGRVKLLDFGIARVRELTTDPTRTLTDGLLGTPAFMPPEQARGNWAEVDAKSDLWALGATMFTLLTGCYVHDAETATETLVVAIAERAPKLKELRPDLPAGLCKVVDRALEYEKSARWPTATIMRLAVRQAMNELKASEVEAKRELALRLAARASDPEIEVTDSESAGESAPGVPAVAAPCTSTAASNSTDVALESGTGTAGAKNVASSPEPATEHRSSPRGDHPERLVHAEQVLAAFDAHHMADEQVASDQSESQVAPSARISLPSDDELTVVRPNPLMLAQSPGHSQQTAPMAVDEAATSEPAPAQPERAESLGRPLAPSEPPATGTRQSAPMHSASDDPHEHGAIPRSSTPSALSTTYPPNTVPSGWSSGSAVSIAASLALAALVIVGVTWIVQRQQHDTAAANQPPKVNATLHAAQAIPEPVVRPRAQPARSATPAPSSRPEVEAPSTDATEAETVDLEELPVLPSIQGALPPSALEQAKEATKRELFEAATRQDSNPAE